MKSNYHDRMMSARDPRYAKIADRLGYNRRDMQAAPAAPAGEDIAGVRAEYEKAVGKKPFNGWDIPTLKAKIAEAKG